ncbi:hypothetical protein OAT16_09675 [Prolixibacteraceae bacterium]|nr:hypothetical protein [Prolixibacteraceae bacterium]
MLVDCLQSIHYEIIYFYKFLVDLQKNNNREWMAANKKYMREAFERIYRQKSKENIAPRVKLWAKQTGLSFEVLK